MEEPVGKVLAFLRRNPQSDIGVKEIGFHLKLNNDEIENVLNTLYQQGLVTARQNEQGKVFWYPLANADEKATRRIKFDTTKINSLVPGKTITRAKKIKKIPYIIAGVVILAILGYSAFSYHSYLDQRMDEMRKQSITISDNLIFKQQIQTELQSIDTKISDLSIKIDSLNARITLLETARQRAITRFKRKAVDNTANTMVNQAAPKKTK